MPPAPDRVLAAVSASAPGRALLALSTPERRLALVGGVVRDLLLGREPRELDAVVEGDAVAVARELAKKLNGTVTVHDRFGTATVAADNSSVDLATARVETYPQPGALPEVKPSTIEQDLARRDFTVNAIAVFPDGSAQAAEHALADLDDKLLRVLHERSFADDPTRLLRMARYAARLGFAPEPQTATLAHEATAHGALATVSPARIGAELRLLLKDQPDPLPALTELDRQQALTAIDPRLQLDPQLLTEALNLLPPDGRPDLLALAAITLNIDPAALARWLDALELPAADRDTVTQAVAGAVPLAHALWRAQRPSQIRAAAAKAKPEAIALAGAHGSQALPAPDAAEAHASAQRWLGDLRHVRLEIGGDDLLAAGLEPGPEIGRRLERALDRKLDGELDGELEPGREAELAAALSA